MGLLDRLRGGPQPPDNPPTTPSPGPEHGQGAAPQLAPAQRANANAFLAIDFETANEQRASACALGFALFENGHAVEGGATLIDPGLDEDDWNPFNIHIHGIQPEDVIGEPSFAEVWSSLSDRYAGLPLVAHNAAFDMSVLRSELGRAQLRPPDTIRYLCSASMSRAAWPELLSVSLPIVADELDIDLDHHEPGSDARASGEILLRVIDALGVQDLEDALRRAHRVWGQIRPDLAWCSTLPPLNAKDFDPGEDGDWDPDHPLCGKTVVFTGTLHSMTRREAFAAIATVGAHPGNGVTKETNILVVGEQDLARLRVGETMSAKERKAADLRLKGQDVQLVSEIEFLRML